MDNNKALLVLYGLFSLSYKGNLYQGFYPSCGMGIVGFGYRGNHIALL